MRNLLVVGFLCVPLSIAAAEARFEGTLEFMPAGCEAKRACKLKYPFGFIDAKGRGWLAMWGPDGLQTDGATIPDWAQPYIGTPFEKSFIRAAVIHDHYCWRQVRTWRETHRAFYEALLVAGVPKAKALVMYFAVYWKGPRWVQLVPGRPCELGTDCLYSAPTVPRVPDTRAVAADGKQFLRRDARYDTPGFASELGTVARLIADKNGSLDLEELEKRAEGKAPADFFFRHGATVEVGPQSGVLE